MIHPSGVALITSIPQQILSRYPWDLSGKPGAAWEQMGTGHRDRGCRGLSETGQALTPGQEGSVPSLSAACPREVGGKGWPQKGAGRELTWATGPLASPTGGGGSQGGAGATGATEQTGVMGRTGVRGLRPSHTQVRARARAASPGPRGPPFAPL